MTEKSIVIRMRFVFPPVARQWLKRRDGHDDLRGAIDALVNTWAQDIQAEYEADKPCTCEPGARSELSHFADCPLY
jgi:hypothetical protein